MADQRDRAYAELIVDGCLGVQPGWQVLVGGNPQARPLLEELCAVSPAAVPMRSCGSRSRDC